MYINGVAMHLIVYASRCVCTMNNNNNNDHHYAPPPLPSRITNSFLVLD